MRLRTIWMRSALWGSLPSGYEAGRVDSLSDYTRNDLHSNEFGLRTTLNWRKVRLNIRFGLSPQKSTTKSNRGKVKIDTTITVLNIVPELHFDYDLGNNHNMSVYYSGYTRQPSIYDLLSVPDYTNPLNITMGNPGLKPAFGQSISVNYRGGNMEKQEMLYCGLRYNNTINDISRKRTYDEKSGVYTSRPENIMVIGALAGIYIIRINYSRKFSLVLLPMQIITGGFRMCR